MKHLQPEDWWAGSFEVDDQEVVVTLTRTELAGLANMIGEALQAVEGWEFDTRVGLMPAEARTLRDEISRALRETARPE